MTIYHPGTRIKLNRVIAMLDRVYREMEKMRDQVYAVALPGDAEEFNEAMRLVMEAINRLESLL